MAVVMHMSLSQLGLALGISKQAVSKAVAKGMPTDSIESAKAWRLANLDVSRLKAARLTVDGEGMGSEVGSSEREVPVDTDEYRRLRTDRERIRKTRELIELEELRGSLLNLAEAKRLAFTAFRSLRDAVLNVPARVKDACAAESDALSIERLLDAELCAALASFKPDAVTRETEDDDDAD